MLRSRDVAFGCHDGAVDAIIGVVDVCGISKVLFRRGIDPDNLDHQDHAISNTLSRNDDFTTSA